MYPDVGERVVQEGKNEIGTIIKFGRKWVHVRMDETGEVQKVSPDDIITVGDNPGHSSFALYAWLRHLGHSHEVVRNWYPGFDCPRKGEPYRDLLKAWGLVPK